MSARGQSAPTAGERWASAELAALRGAGYGPEAWRRFVARSVKRSADTRRRRRPVARQAARWIAVSAPVMVAGRRAALRRGGGAPSARGLAGAWVIGAAMVRWHLGMVEGFAGEPREKLGVADALTLSRAAVAPFAASAPPDRAVFLALLALAGASDLLDGQLARRAGPTRFGRDFDPLADLVFRAAAVRGAARAGWMPAGPVALLAVRQALLVGGSAWSWFAHARRPLHDPAGVSRWDALPLLLGLALAATGRRRAGGALVSLAAGVGTVGLSRARGVRQPPGSA